MAKSKTFLELAEMTEVQAREYLEQIRWPDGPCCVHCGEYAVTKLQGKSTRPGVYKCKGCRKQFTVTVGTIFHRSHIPLKKWVMAFHLMCASKKGVSALQLQRQLGLKGYQSAWHMAHRIRHAMRSEPLKSMLTGDVEADETYVGARKPRRKGVSKPGRGTKKSPVMVLVERGGRARALALSKVNVANLGSALREHVSRDARLFTDEYNLYNRPGRAFRGGHERVKHRAGEYARGEAHVNTAESFNGLLKRGVMGAFHHVSKQHLQRYCDEFAFRWNTRFLTDGERTTVALQESDGKRLCYRPPV